MICFYHIDLDGECSAAIVYKAKNKLGKYIPVNYDKKFPLDIISLNEEVILVDYNFDKDEDFESLKSITKNIVLIDHHLKSVDSKFDNIKGIRRTDKAGCELTWEYFFPTVKVPKAVELIGDFDTWKFKYGEYTKQFQAGLKIKDTCPESDIWNLLFALSEHNNLVDETVKQGVIINEYMQVNNKRLIDNLAFVTRFEGYKCIACNIAFTGAMVFDSLKEDFDIKIIFYFNGRVYNISLYTEKNDIDVNRIANKYGGGGHKKAAGFQIEILPFKK